MTGFRKTSLCLFIAFTLGAFAACGEPPQDTPPTHPDTTRAESLPEGAQKRTPETDHHPPILHSPDFSEPIPLPGPVNTAGLEDAPFVTPDGNTLYFFFTPNADFDYSAQLLDGVSGIWKSARTDGVWQEPVRIWLQEPGRLALDGCPALWEDEFWFCSAREGYAGVMMFSAEKTESGYENIAYVGDHLMHDVQIGEVHLHGDDLYFHAQREGGAGGSDIWVITRENGVWGSPVNVESVNTAAHESLPFVTPDGNELWFTREHMGTPALFRSVREGVTWGSPELVVSQFAGEPTLDSEGNLYFTHHFYEHGVMIEADIYFAARIGDAGGETAASVDYTAVRTTYAPLDRKKRTPSASFRII